MQTQIRQKMFFQFNETKIFTLQQKIACRLAPHVLFDVIHVRWKMFSEEILFYLCPHFENYGNLLSTFFKNFVKSTFLILHITQ